MYSGSLHIARAAKLHVRPTDSRRLGNHRMNLPVSLLPSPLAHREGPSVFAKQPHAQCDVCAVETPGMRLGALVSLAISVPSGNRQRGAAVRRKRTNRALGFVSYCVVVTT
jgi:hypothetical protein